MRKKPPAADEPLPDDDEIESAEEGLPPLPDAPTFLPGSNVEGATRETEQQRAQFQGRLLREAEEEEGEQAAVAMSDLVVRYAAGYFRVDRMGPRDLPSSEIGDCGAIKLRELDANADIRDIVAGQYGGGQYRLTLHGARGNEIAKVPPLFFEIRGDIKPNSTDGHAYLNRRKNTAGEGGASDSTATQALNLLREQVNAGRREDPNGGLLIEMVKGLLAGQNSTKERELAEIRAKSEKELAEIKAKSEREERESKEKLERERIASDERVKLAAEEAKGRQHDARYTRKYEFLAQKVAANLALKREEMASAGPLGVDGAKKLRGELIGAAVRKAMDDAGLGGAPDEEKNDIAEYFKTAGLNLVDKHGDRILDLVDRLFAKPGAPPRAPASDAPALPAPAGPSGPQPAPAAPSIDVSQGPPPATTPAVEGEAAPPAGTDAAPPALSPIDAAKFARVTAFLQAVSVELTTDADPAYAWESRAGETGPTVETLYGLMASPFRRAFSDGGWPALRPLLPLEHFGAGVQFFDNALLTTDGADWFAGFVEAGPWNEADEDEETSEGE